MASLQETDSMSEYMRARVEKKVASIAKFFCASSRMDTFSTLLSASEFMSFETDLFVSFSITEKSNA